MGQCTREALARNLTMPVTGSGSIPYPVIQSKCSSPGPSPDLHSSFCLMRKGQGTSVKILCLPSLRKVPHLFECTSDSAIVCSDFIQWLQCKKVWIEKRMEKGLTQLFWQHESIIYAQQCGNLPQWLACGADLLTQLRKYLPQKIRETRRAAMEPRADSPSSFLRDKEEVLCSHPRTFPWSERARSSGLVTVREEIATIKAMSWCFTDKARNQGA